MSGTRHRTLRRLGRGGMAEVWLAEDDQGARVALKRVLPEHAADPRFRRMFLDEAAIARSLDHPGIVRVIESGDEDGVPWLAMELVDGLDAAEWMERGRERGVVLPEAGALRIAADVARALHAAHEARDATGAPRAIVHRDVSPGNVLIARDGTVKLADFGIAKARDRLEKTSAGATKGKMAFMAPEQMLGAELDRRADVFGLGCTLHTLLAGRSAMGDERDAATLMSGGELRLDPHLADDVRAIVARSVASSRVKRWPSTAAMADALDVALAERGHDGRAELAAWIAAIDALDHATRDELPARSATPTASHTKRSSRRTAFAIGALVIAVAGVVIGARYSAAATEEGAHTPARAANARESIETQPMPAHSAGVDRESPSSIVPGAPDPGSVAPHAAADVSTARVAATDDAARAPDLRRPSPRDRAPDTDHVPAPERGRVPDPTPRPAPPAPSSAEAPAPPAIAPTATTGFLVVGGPGALRHIVFVDGARRDFAPVTLELAIGRHAIEVRDPAGGPTASRTVEVRGDHTRRSPVRWIVAAQE